MKSIYLSFLALADSLTTQTTSLQNLDLDAKKLLEIIAVHNARQQPLTVTQVMQMHAIASPATIHKKINQLQTAGLINMEHQGSNRRTKYLTTTPKADSYFEEIGAEMVKAVKTA